MAHTSFGIAGRAVVVVACLVAPFAVVGGGAGADGFAFAALFAGLFVAAEYGARAPGLVEFRDAPPYNRIRFAVLAGALLFGSGAAAEGAVPIGASARAAGLAVAAAVDWPGSPLRALLSFGPAAAAADMRAVAGAALLAAAAGVGGFALVLRLTAWPGPADRLNLWVALPLFDAAERRTLPARLRRDGRVNLLLAVALPYAAPPVAAFVGGAHGISAVGNDLLLVWAVALWILLPAMLLLRGMALHRLAAAVAAADGAHAAGPRAVPAAA